jgi:hypothetical protein
VRRLRAAQGQAGQRFAAAVYVEVAKGRPFEVSNSSSGVGAFQRDIPGADGQHVGTSDVSVAIVDCQT